MYRRADTAFPPVPRNLAAWAVIKGTLLAFILSLVLLLLASLVLHFTAVPEKITPYLVFGISLAAILFGSRFSGRHIGYRGWLHGGLVGFFYVLLLLLLSVLFVEGFAFNFSVVTKVFLGFAFGAAGGMWGVNSG